METLNVIVFGIVTILSILYIYFKFSFNYWKSNGVPYLEPSFPYGNLKGFGVTIHPSIFFQNLYDKFKGSAQFFGIYFFSEPVPVILDLDLVKNILVKDFDYFTERGIYYNEKDDPLSAHLFSLDGPKWKVLRPKLTSTFTSGKMKFMFPTIVEVGHQLRDCLDKLIKENDELEIKEVLARFTTDVIGTCAFGIECNSLKDPNTEFRNMGRKVFGEPRHSQYIIAFKNNFKNVARILGMKTNHDDVSEFFLNAVFDTVKYREQNNVHRNDFMDLLISIKNEQSLDKQLTMNEIAAQAFIFFLAGFETSSTTLTYCLYELALNKDIQTKTRQQIQNAFKKHNGQFTYEMMMDISYIDHVLQGNVKTSSDLSKYFFYNSFFFCFSETMRKYPPVANLTRRVRKNYKIPGTDLEFKKGMTVIIPIYAIQRDSEYYPDPEKFDPDRFEVEEVKKRDHMTWLPFGEGNLILDSNK